MRAYFPSFWCHSHVHSVPTQARMRTADSKGALLTGYAPVTQHAHVRDLLEGEEIVALMGAVLGETPATLSQKWVCR